MPTESRRHVLLTLGDYAPFAQHSRKRVALRYIARLLNPGLSGLWVAYRSSKTCHVRALNRMSNVRTRVAKEIAIAVKSGGPDPHSNPALRRCFQNARAVNMPKDKVEAAIKRASGKDAANYTEIIYEGYAPHGVALLVETATDNPTRTAGNVRHGFNKYGGNLASSGSVSFMFKKMGVFRLKPDGIDQDDLELYRSITVWMKWRKHGRKGEHRSSSAAPSTILAMCKKRWKIARSNRSRPNTNTFPAPRTNYRKIKPRSTGTHRRARTRRRCAKGVSHPRLM